MPRFPFVAPAEVLADQSSQKMAAHVKELSLYGCYLDTNAPLPTKTEVMVKIFGEEDFFEARATVIYANLHIGMGVAFRDVRPAFLAILRKWLLAALQESHGSG